jgi:DNA end-binding protein Ku
VEAYRLLAEAMETTGRARIATFVMRQREYLVAIFARKGILCAETLRFHDEIRDPAAIGLSEAVKAPRQRVLAFERAVSALSSRAVSTAELVDQDDRRLRAVIAKNRRAGKDMIRTEEWAEPGDSEPVERFDLLETIKRSLRRPNGRRVSGPEPAGPSRKRADQGQGSRRPAADRKSVASRRRKSALNSRGKHR